MYTYCVCTYLSMNQIMCIKTGWLIPVRITTKIFLYNILFKENLLSNVKFVCPIMPLLHSMNSTKSSNFILNFCPQENILSCFIILFSNQCLENISIIFCILWNSGIFVLCYPYKIEGIRLELNSAIFGLFRYVDKLGLCCR